MKVRIDYDQGAIPARLAEWGHPFASEWTLNQLHHCLVARILEDEGDDPIVGYVWFHWENNWAKRLEMHICVRPGARRRWYTRRVRKDILDLVRLCDAQYLIARAITPAISGALSLAGFEFIPACNWWALPIPENHV